MATSRHKGYYHYAVVRSKGRNRNILPMMEPWTSNKREATQEAKVISIDNGGYPVEIYWADLLDGKLSKVGRVKAKMPNPSKITKGKKIKVKAVKFNRNGSVTLYK